MEKRPKPKSVKEVSNRIETKNNKHEYKNGCLNKF